MVLLISDETVLSFEPFQGCPVSFSRGLNILRLIECSHPTGNLHNEIHQKHCRAALCIALLTCYLLVPSNGKVSASLATVTSQMLEDKNMVPLVLAETLLGLDQICAEGVEGMLQFAGSPLLLQVIIFVYAPSFCHFSVP
ncbi:hypothetical protein RHMOL_Rhmol13G0056900 [Rhododendron molle]|uniref:Uncharacterized protein n=1 Tax=Rhododendron molle TaxID=49168 RepID=A0ACC0L4V3_RHOML|nr:hypothetical protein RHMOL_Rhmol13G0056900 [Rhododendron molle]